MQLLTPDLRARLLANGTARGDHAPVVKFFSPVGAATWLFSELDEDGDSLFGLCRAQHNPKYVEHRVMLRIAFPVPHCAAPGTDCFT